MILDDNNLTGEEALNHLIHLILGVGGSLPTPPPPPFEPPSKWFTDPETGVIWRILLPDDDNGNALIITERVFGVGTARFSDVNMFRTFEGSDLQLMQNAWYADDNNVGATIRNHAMSYEFQNNNGNTVPRQNANFFNITHPISAGIEVDVVDNSFHIQGNVLRARTRALAGAGEVFTLSMSEVMEYFADNADRVARNAIGTLAYSEWLLRSPAGGTNVMIQRVNSSNGAILNRLPANTGGHRPALWVDADLLREVEYLPELPVIPPTGSNSIWRDPDTGFDWIIASHEGDYTMLVSRYIIQYDRIPGFSTNRYHDVNSFVQWPAQVNGTGGPGSRTAMRAWWHSATQVSTDLRNAAVNANIPRDTNTASHACNTGNCAANTRTANTFLSTPVSTASIIDNPVFFLSEAEIITRMGQNTNALRQTQRIAAGSNNFGSSGLNGSFWLRSAGRDAHFTAATVNNDGVWSAANADFTGPNIGFRPAIWVNRQSGIFESGVLPQTQVLQENMEVLQTNFSDKSAEFAKRLDEFGQITDALVKINSVMMRNLDESQRAELLPILTGVQALSEKKEVEVDEVVEGEKEVYYIDELPNMNLKELRDLANELNIPNYSAMRKATLIEAISEASEVTDDDG